MKRRVHAAAQQREHRRQQHQSAHQPPHPLGSALLHQPFGQGCQDGRCRHSQQPLPGRIHHGVTAFTAGDVTIRREGGRETASLLEQAERLMAPYVVDGGFFVQGVRG